jgi:hypothetical protein
VPVGTDGQFRFQPVVPGIFLVKARRFPPTSSSVFQSGIGVVLGTPGTVVPIMSTAPTLWADWTGEIKPGLNQVAMSMRHGARIAGRVQLDSDLARRITLKDLFGTAVIVSRADGGPLGTLPLGRIEADGTFRTAEVPPGKYSVMVPIRLNDVSVDSIRSGSRQAIGSYLEVGDQDTEDVVVNLTGSLAAISGHVSQPGKNPVSVYAFPTDRALWRDYGLSATLLRSVQAATDGSYALDLLPGSYHIVAGPTGIDQWRDVDSLQKFVGASVVVRLVRSERRQQDLIVR